MSGSGGESDGGEGSRSGGTRIDHTNPKNRRRTGREQENNKELPDSQETFADRAAGDEDAEAVDDVVEGFTSVGEADSDAGELEMETLPHTAVTDALGEVGSGQTGPSIDSEVGDDETGGSTTETPESRADEALEQFGDIGGEIVDADDYKEKFQLGEEVTPDVPDDVNLDNVLRVREIDDGGINDDSMFIAATGEGDVMWVTPEEAYGNPLDGGAIQNSIAASIEGELDGVTVPEANVDEERDLLAVADANNSQPVHQVDKSANIDRDSYLRAVSLKFLAGDYDIPGNVVVDDDGEFYPIDFDLAGHQLQDEDPTEAQEYNWVRVQCVDQDGWETPSEEEFKSVLQDVASQIDSDEFTETVDATWDLQLRRRNSVIENIVYATEGDI